MKRDRPFTPTEKCVEIFHWCHATFADSEGELRINETIVEKRVSHTLADATLTAEVMRQMLRLRDPKGVYDAGGCIDTTREAPRLVCPGTTDIVLPVS